jgi:UDP-N-acetylmuramoyl-tripeptide--D-alanyl-D-alanine ligase
MEIKDIHNLFLQCSSISIDTRNIEKGSFFVALKGDRYDSNLLAQEALDKGALYVIIDNKSCYIDDRTIVVNDSLQTLQALSKYHRRYLNLPIIAITGSNGKTTTKELIYTVLSKKYNTKATIGNLNNHIGVPLTLLSFDESTEFGIVEMGANHQKEIEFLCEICQPDYGYITNFGKAHLEGFGGYDGVIKGKSEMYNYLRDNKKTAFVNYDDVIQNQKTELINRINFSTTNKDCFLFIKTITAEPFAKVSYNNIEINSHLIGLYNATNINVAISIGKYFEISDHLIKDAIENYIPENNRSQIITTKFNKVILDAYNANPSSMVLAIDNFLNLNATNKTIIIGDMFELGEESLSEHQAIIDILKYKEDVFCYFIGNYFNKLKIIKDNFNFFENYEDFHNYLIYNKVSQRFILIKGSRGMALERTLEIL